MKQDEQQRPQFSFKTHVRDPKSGRVITTNHYRRIVSLKDGGGTIVHNERPVGSGIFYFDNNEIDQEASKDGLAKKAQIEADKNKTEFEKAKDKMAQATAELKLAELNYKAEQDSKARKNEPAKADAKASGEK